MAARVTLRDLRAAHKRAEQRRHFWHRVNGQTYNTIALNATPATMTEYRNMVREAYGSLQGVTFGTGIR